MHSKDWAGFWNACYGDKLPLTPEVIDFTYTANPSQTPVTLTTPSFQLLCKSEKNLFRLHLPIPLSRGSSLQSENGLACVNLVKAEAQKRGAQKIIFGGGERHLFPGIPLNGSLKNWLNLFSPKENEVADLEADLNFLVNKNKERPCLGSLRNIEDAREQKMMLDFVREEFPGRWTRELTHDLENQFLKYYFGYFVEGKILGYVRLYGWDTLYRGPGTYFASSEAKLGALGPVGVSVRARGQGLGLQILKASWDILLARGCSRVRVDWVSDVEFYEKRGLRVVQNYQMAQILLEN